MQKEIKVAPSILSADFSQLSDEIKRVEKAGADLLHIDVMDGHFVKNITIGPLVVKSIRPKTQLPIISHLMIDDPEDYIKAFAEAGSDGIIFHIEATNEPEKIIKQINSFDKKAGIAVNPETEIWAIESILDKLDMVLIMSVHPGFGGQEFISEVLPKIKELRDGFQRDIAVDGGINSETAREVIEAGANVMVAGTYIFASNNIRNTIESLRG